MPSHGQSASVREQQRLKKLKLDHLRVDLHLDAKDWRSRLKQAGVEAAGIETGLEAALFLTDNFEAELRSLIVEAADCGAPIRLWTVYGPASFANKNLDAALSMLRSTGWNIPIAAGTNANFAEWNRNRPRQGLEVMPCFAMTPQIHAFDRISMVETLQAQAMAVDSAWQWALHPVVVSHVTLRPRFNAVATNTAQNTPNPHELPHSVDLRQLSLFCAGWTLGSIAALCGSGHCHSCTFYETTGWRGIMETEQGSPLPDIFPSIPGAVFPVYHVFAGVAGYSYMAPVIVRNHREIAGFALFQGDKMNRVFIANLGPNPVDPNILLDIKSVRLAILDAMSAVEAMTNPERWHPETILDVSDNRLMLHLPPYAIARIDRMN